LNLWPTDLYDGPTVGWLPSKFLFFGMPLTPNLTNITSVPVAFCARSRPSDSRHCSLHRLLLLGNPWCKTSNVPITPEARTTRPLSHSRDHLRLRSQLLLDRH